MKIEVTLNEAIKCGAFNSIVTALDSNADDNTKLVYIKEVVDRVLVITGEK